MRKKAKLESNEKLSAMERHERISCLTMDGCPIEDLGLDFTLPGYPNIGKRFIFTYGISHIGTWKWTTKIFGFGSAWWRDGFLHIFPLAFDRLF